MKTPDPAALSLAERQARSEASLQRIADEREAKAAKAAKKTAKGGR